MKSIGASFVIAAAISATCLSAQDDQGARMRALLESRAASVVTVRAVIKIEMSLMGRSQDEESRAEAQGVIVDPSGLIMMSNSVFSPPNLGRGMMRRMGRGEMEAKATPVDIKVVFGQEDEEHSAYLAATDAKLGLAFLQVKDLGERKLTAVTMGDAEAKVQIGDELLSVDRLGKGYDFAPLVTVHRVLGQIKKPRPAYVCGGPIGLPAFTASGDIAGIFVSIEPASDEDEGMGLARLLGGGGSLRGSTYLLAGKAIKSVIEQAKKKALEIGAEQQAAPESKPTTPKEGDAKDEKG
jgi:hypothetical protein